MVLPFTQKALMQPVFMWNVKTEASGLQFSWWARGDRWRSAPGGAGAPEHKRESRK